MSVNFAILKPDKGNGIVILKRSDYINSLTSLFDNPNKFKKVLSDPTYTRLTSLQAYLSTLLKRGEISVSEFNCLRPKSAHFGRAHGLPKIHKTFQFIPKFRPIIDTTNTPHYNVGKFLSNLLNPLMFNDFTLRDTFQAVDAIKSVPKHLFAEGYQFVSFDVESLFTNVPLKKTVNIILKRIFAENQIQTTLTKRTLKKLILDSCTKTTFSFNKQLYEQVDGVSMGSSLGPVLANIILTEFEKEVVSELIKSGIIKFYQCYVDDTLALIKPSDNLFVLSKFNNFDKNLKFAVDSFSDGNIHFHDLKISDNDIDVY